MKYYRPDDTNRNKDFDQTALLWIPNTSIQYMLYLN